jgi:integrase
MPTIKLTQAAVDRLSAPAEKAITFWDNQCPGFGLRITARNRRTWIAMYRVKGRAVMETLGTTAQTPSVAVARNRARDSMTRARDGINPVADRRETEKRAASSKALTFGAVAERFVREHIERNSSPKHAREVGRILDHDVQPRWGAWPIREITKHDVNDLLDAKSGHRERRRKGTRDGAVVQANRTRALLRTLFRWAVDMDLIDADPTAGVRQRVKERARDRALNDAEIRLFWSGCDKLGWPFGPLFELLLLTAQRRDEVGGVRWAEIDIDRHIWRIPRERAKSDRAHIVHLSAPAIEILEALPRTGDLVFSATGTTPVSGYSRAKDRIDKLMMMRVREETGDPEAEIVPWILHDLRRTATTGMAALNIAPHVVDKILNHSAGTIRGVAAVYNRHAYLEERKAAQEAWGRHVMALVRPGASPSNVVAIDQARA